MLPLVRTLPPARVLPLVNILPPAGVRFLSLPVLGLSALLAILVAWTVDDLLQEIRARDPALARKVVLLDDCASPVVVPGVVDFTDVAEAAYARFSEAGMRRARSTELA